MPLILKNWIFVKVILKIEINIGFKTFNMYKCGWLSKSPYSDVKNDKQPITYIQDGYYQTAFVYFIAKSIINNF